MDSSPPSSLSPCYEDDHRSSFSPPSPSIPILKTSSFKRLNAKAPEFVPRTSSSPCLAAVSSPSASSSPLFSPNSLFSPTSMSSSLSSPLSEGDLVSLSQQNTDLAGSFVIPRPPGPPALIHVYNTTAQIPSPIEGHYGGYGYGGVQFYGGQHQHDLSPLAPSAISLAPVITSAVHIQGNSDTMQSPAAASSLSNGLSDEAALKLMKQVEFYFSDVNLATTGYLFKFMCKDPEGYVPISAVASIKKIKTLTKSQSQLAAALRGSTKLVVSDDGKKVKRQDPLTETDMEEVQSRIIIAENLPEDHCHQTLMRIFSAVGSVKSIRTCQPGGPSSTPKASKADGVNFSNKLHAFVEYDTTELAEKAVTELNEGNWRNGLKVQLLLKQHSPKSGQSRVKIGDRHEAEFHFKEEDAFAAEHLEINELEESTHLTDGEEHSHDKDGGGPRKGRSREGGEKRNRGKGRGRQSHHVNNRGNHAGATSIVTVNIEQSAVGKQPCVPRMPDGTRGFSMGRGKPLTVKIARYPPGSIETGYYPAT